MALRVVNLRAIIVRSITMFMFRKSSEWNIKSRNGLVLTDPVIRHSLFLIPPKKNYWCHKKVQISFYNYNLPVSSSTIKGFSIVVLKIV